MTEIATTTPLYINFTTGIWLILVVGLILQFSVVIIKKVQRYRNP